MHSKDTWEPAIGGSFPDIRFRGRNGWTQATSIDVIKNMAGTSYYFARALHRELDRPIGIVVAGRGGTTLWQWTAEELHQTPELVPYRAVMEQRNRAYEEQKKKKIKNISYEPAAGFSPYRYPYFGFTFGEMAGFDNWVPNFKGKGIVFWQGENDIGLGAPYEQLCGGMVNRWRERADRQWPFFFIQLPTYMDKARKPSKYRGIEVIRDAQRRVAAADPLSHMMVSYDIYGRGIHPSSKVAYGERLAQTVLGIVYDKEIPWRSPEFIGAERSADGMELRFDHVRQGLKTRGGEAELKGFVLAGDDGVFHPATAEITAKDTVVVRSDLVPAPSAVRYAWATNPVANLVGDGDLPVSPFRSDDWPLYPLDN
jgi:sialate O-acetylesterase